MTTAVDRWRLALGAAAFVVLATLNSGGYHFGSADQAFYIPAILKRLDPALFPRDTALIGPQARYFFVDEIVAGLIRATGLPMEAWFAAGYVLTLLTLYGAVVALGRTLYRTEMAVWVFVAAETLRHRITKTGVNTLEGYFHPRVFVFAVGVAAIVAYLRGRHWLAFALVSVAGLLHPTTAAFFLIFLAAATWTTEPGARRVLAGAGAAALVGAAFWMAAADGNAFATMDADWQRLLATKDYLFPTRDWRASAWFANLATAALAIGVFWWRPDHAAGSPRERGLAAGAFVLLAGFLVTLPLVAAGSAFPVQLQISRVFWVLDLLAVAALVALVADAPRTANASATRWRTALVAIVVAVSTARGLWGTFVAHADRDPVGWSLPSDDWSKVIRWAAGQPPATHFLADPGHAWRYGAPLRYSGRDVLLEEVKDTSMAIYARPSAERVLLRLDAIGDFASIDESRAHDLARRFDLDLLVIDRDLALPEVHREGRFRVYRVR